MGWWAKLWGAGETADAWSGTPCIGDIQDRVSIAQHLKREAGVIAATVRLIHAYGAVLETVCEGHHGQGRRLHPESMLPCPKETIRAALALAFLQLESQGWPKTGTSPADLLSAVKALDIHFVPDQEVPVHPIDNWLAFTRRLRTLSTVGPSPAASWITADTVGWEGLLVMAGVPQDRRDPLITALGAAARPPQTDQRA